METYKIVNGDIVKEEIVGAKSPAVKAIKAEIEELRAKKANIQIRIDDAEERKAEVQSKIDSLKAFLLSIGE